jgi:hypothetical protein
MPEPTSTRIYIVERKPNGEDMRPTTDGYVPPPRLVRANHPSPALRHVAQDSYTVRVASQDDIIAALARKVQVEQAGDAL